MRYLIWAVAVAVVVVACGPTGAEIRTAKTAEYQAPLAQVFDAAIQETQADYKIGDIDPENGRFATTPQFFAEDGTRLTEGAEGTVQNVRDHSKLMHLVIEVKRVAAPGDDRLIVAITPKTFEIIGGSPKPRELALDDPSLPPWVNGRVDALAVRIYNRLKPLVAPP